MPALSSRHTFAICVLIVTGPAGRPAPAADMPASSREAFLDRYCAACHNQKTHAAGLVLQNSNSNHPESNPAVWEKVIRKVGGGEMPPAGMPRGDDASLKMFTAGLVHDLDAAAPNAPYARPPGLRRVNCL